MLLLRANFLLRCTQETASTLHLNETQALLSHYTKQWLGLMARFLVAGNYR
jgi:hypothetical protein